MSGRKHLLNAALIYTMANIANASIPFLLIPVLTRALSPSEYGIVTMFGLLTSLAGTLTGLSVHGAIGIRFFEGTKWNLPRYITSCITILLPSSIVVITATLAFHFWIERLTYVPLGWLMIAVLVSTAQFIVQIQLVIWRVNHEPIKYATFQIGQSLVNASLSLFTVLYIGMAWQGRLFGITAASIIFATLSACFLWKSGWIKFPPATFYMIDALKFGTPLIPHALGMMAISMMDRLFITYLMGISQTGIYAVAIQIGMALELIASSFNMAFSPWLFGKLNNIKIPTKIKIVRLTYLYFAVILASAIIISSITPYIIPIIAGNEYQQAEGMIKFIVMGSAFKGMYYMVTNYVFYAGKTKHLAVNTFICGIFSFTLSYFFIIKFGLAGAAIGFMICQFLLFAGTWWIANRAYPMPWFAAMKIQSKP
ncbi:MAG: oligosaccharide flippase family protein [Aquabacterium sp.]|uniref:lipopolysaccharide biosynthesis protein n=1 Tax=Aquabacterium sp. TaxID=1872578 RepID=UPI0027233129|nr:oligosaccharide flippase family protein [Aquabacterium sp.]MDO9005992.1 oligosaccharide flippase family protein [Aquabacterium sp.]